MTLNKLVWALALAIAAPTAWAYGASGGGNGRKVCDQVEFSGFTPADKSTVSAGSEFSFKVSPKIKPDSIKVNVKGQPIAVTTTPLSLGYQVRGRLPSSLKNAFARISLQAEGLDKCQGSAGWLVKIAE